MGGIWLHAPKTEGGAADEVGAVAGRSEGAGVTARVSRARSIAATARDPGTLVCFAAASRGGFPVAAFFLSAG